MITGIRWGGWGICYECDTLQTPFLPKRFEGGDGVWRKFLLFFGFGLDFEPWRGREDIHETTRLDGTGLTE